MQKRKAKIFAFLFYALNTTILHQVNRFPHIAHTDQPDVSTML